MDIHISLFILFQNISEKYLYLLFNFSLPRLSSVNLESAVPYPTDKSIATAVEVCQCPPGYSGNSCEVSL